MNDALRLPPHTVVPTLRPSEYTAALIQVLRAHPEKVRGANVLEIGSGSAVVLAALGDLGAASLCGVDIEHDAIDGDRAVPIVCRNDLKFHLLNDIRDELGATKAHRWSVMGMALYGAFHEILDAHFIESVPYLLQLELMDDGFYLLHGTPPRAGYPTHNYSETS
jgi:protein-L-isoaspartate O-methyltransferase